MIAVDTNRKVDTSDIIIRILRSNRRSLAGRVLPDSSIEVRAPLAMPPDTISKWLDRFEPQFMPLVRQCREVNAYLLEHPFGYGGEVLFMGKWIPIQEAEDDNGGRVVQYRDGTLVARPGLSEADLRYWITDLFSTLARPIIEKRFNHYSDLMGVWCKTWTIGNARKRHGSCDSNRKITFSWLIVMMSEAVMDYIIVHELAHLKQMNHSKAFRDEVAAVLPDCKERQKAHSEYGLMLRCGGWI
jgi:predicted metal-dependent hydrolase